MLNSSMCKTRGNMGPQDTVQEWLLLLEFHNRPMVCGNLIRSGYLNNVRVGVAKKNEEFHSWSSLKLYVEIEVSDMRFLPIQDAAAEHSNRKKGTLEVRLQKTVNLSEQVLWFQHG